MTAPDPIARFRELYARAVAAIAVNPNAMALCTVGPDGGPSARFVLLKSFDERGFVFYTNLQSRKGHDIAREPRVALCLYWQPLDAQVRIEGRCVQVDDAEADAYFATRPRASQLGTWASDQSAALESLDLLDRRMAELEQRYAQGPIPRPPHWSGLRVVPDRIEFWHSRPDRLHERELYERAGEGWTTRLLYP